MTHSDALEVTIASDPVLSLPQHTAEVELARALAKQLDAQAEPQTRTVASYAGVLGALRRIIKQAEAARAKEAGTAPKTASRLSLIKDQAKRAAG